MMQAVRSAVVAHGIAGVARLAVRRALGGGAACSPLVRELARNRVGLEVGGPSPIFCRRGLLPIYPFASRIDNCNFRATTVWHEPVREGWTFVFDRRRAPGRQFIAEATDLAPIPTGIYDFVLSSHALEHSANPLRALVEFDRVLKGQGTLVLVLPHKQMTFDHQRPVTSMAHLLEDFAASIGEGDATHVAEILALHDSSRDPGVADQGAFVERCRTNIENRCAHHHVFDTALAVELVGWLRWPILAVEPTIPHHIIVVARKDTATAGANARFCGAHAAFRKRSPFSLDRCC